MNIEDVIRGEYNREQAINAIQQRVEHYSDDN